jgi:RNA polymerase sigma-70 factor (ECF subfamily)
MIRITTESSNGIRLIVEGHLSGLAVDELRKSCAEQRVPVIIDLTGVVFADRVAAVLLKELIAAGFAVEGSSGFIQELLHENQLPPKTEDQETGLIEKLRTGDDGAYEVMVRRYGGRMLAAARRILKNEPDAHDAVQEAFLSVFRSIGNFAGEAALSTWLHRIVINAALMKIRSRRRRCEESIEPLLPRFKEDGNWAQEGCPNIPLDDLLERRERLVSVRECMDKLPEGYRTVLLLRDIEDFDTEETARLLNVTPTAVKVRLHRARQALKTLIERECGHLPNPRTSECVAAYVCRERVSSQ